MSEDGRRARWEQHNADRRTHILDAAVAVLEDAAPGAEIRVQQIADHAAVGRTVVYRHFVDRADLDRAVQAHVLSQLRGRIEPQVVLQGSVESIIGGIIGAYVGWADEHPALHRIASDWAPASGKPSPLVETLDLLSGQVSTLVRLAAAMLAIELSEEEDQALDPLVTGLIGQAFATVRHWLARPERRPAPAEMADLLARSIWYLLEGHIRRHGVELDPTVPIETLIGATS